MNIKIARVNENAILPEFKTKGAAGADLYSCENAWIEPGETKLIHLGIKSEFPHDLVALIYARSGLATNHGLAPANKVGVIDSDYRGEWMVALHNHSDSKHYIAIGDRVAQVLFQPVVHPTIDQVEESELTYTSRGDGGFNSTGK